MRSGSSLISQEDVRKYVDRFKETVGRLWTRNIERAAAETDPERRCLCSDRRTVVEFTLDRSGVIRDVVVTRSSRVAFLDRVSLEAMNEVRQVADPPPSLFADGDTVTMGFAFVLGTGRKERPPSCASGEGL